MGKRVMKLTDVFMADAGTLIQRILPAAGKVGGDAETLHPLSLGDLLRQYHVFEAADRLVECDGIFRLGGRTSRHLFHACRYRRPEFLPNQIAEFFQPFDVPLIQQAFSGGWNIQMEAGVGANRGEIGVEQPLQ